jgi:hypothetical protein
MQEYLSDSDWVAPPGVDHLFVLLCGAGGGGASARVASGSSDTQGAGGGAGGTVMSMIGVTPGGTYGITVGRGGQPGAGVQEAGQPGGFTRITDPSWAELARADGGDGGAYDANGQRLPGLGAAGFYHLNGGFVRRGGNGSPLAGGGGVHQLCSTYSVDHVGGGGNGGSYNPFTQQLNPGLPGENGWALLIW